MGDGEGVGSGGRLTFHESRSDLEDRGDAEGGREGGSLARATRSFRSHRGRGVRLVRGKSEII